MARCGLVIVIVLLAVAMWTGAGEQTAAAPVEPVFTPSESQWREYMKEVEQIRRALDSIAQSQKEIAKR